MRPGAIALLVLQALALRADAADPVAFFRPSVVLSDRDQRSLDRGTPVTSIVDSDGRQVAVFSVMPVGGSVDADRLIAWLRSIAALKQSRYVLALKRFSAPPRLDDLAALSLDEADLNEVRRCRPGKCGLKLSASEIETLQRAIRGAGSDWRAAVQTAFRGVVLERVQTYLQKGHAGLPAYADRDGAPSLETAFRGLVQRSPFLAARVPRLTDYLTGSPAVSAPEDVESFLYWSSEKLGNKPVVSATHVLILRGNPGGPDVLVASKQVFATHYMDGSLGLTALISEPSGNRRYLAYLNRSDLDVLGGFWGRLVRLVLERRLRSEAPAVLRQLNERLSSGPPPVLQRHESRLLEPAPADGQAGAAHHLQRRLGRGFQREPRDEPDGEVTR